MKIWGLLVSPGNTFLFFKDNQIFSIWISHEVLCSVKYSHFSSVWKKAACYRRIGLGSLGKETHIGHSAVASPPRQATPHFESQLCHLQNEGAGWGPLKAICPQGQAAELLPKVSSSWLLVLEHKGTCDSCRMERIAGHTDDLCRLWRGPMLAFPFHRLLGYKRPWKNSESSFYWKGCGRALTLHTKVIFLLGSFILCLYSELTKLLRHFCHIQCINFIWPLIQSYCLRMFYVPDILLNARDIMVKKTVKVSALTGPVV